MDIAVALVDRDAPGDAAYPDAPAAQEEPDRRIDACARIYPGLAALRI
jgi:hypothetical protein